MASVLFGFGFSLLTALVVILGDTIIKVGADGGHSVTSKYVVAGCLIYAASAVLWFCAMRHVSLAQGGVAFAMCSLIALAVIGAVAFDEPIRLREILGIGCAILAMGLMIRVA